MFTFLETVSSIFLTVAVYLFIPVTLILIGKPFSKRTLFTVSLLNAIIMFLLKNFVCYVLLGDFSTNSTPAFFWSFIGYELMKRRILFQKETSEPPEKETDLSPNENYQHENISQDFSQINTNPVYMKQPARSSSKKSIFPLVFVFVITLYTTVGILFVLAQQRTASFEVVQKRFIADQLSTQYDAGHDNGQRAGYEEGYVDGVEYGYGNGLTHKYYSESDPYNIGYEDGYNVGFIEGHDEGYRDVSDDSNYDRGFDDGYEKCYSEYEDWISLSSLVGLVVPYITIFIIIWAFYLLMSRIIKLTIAPDVSEKTGPAKRVFSALVIAVLVVIIIYLAQSFNFPPVYTKTAQISSQETSRRTEPVRKAVSESTKDSSSSITVYVTETGSKYHRSSCSSLRKSKIAIPLDEAIESYEPCERCSPPTQ